MRAAMPDNLRAAICLPSRSLLLLFGAAGLIDQVVWSKALGLIFATRRTRSPRSMRPEASPSGIREDRGDRVPVWPKMSRAPCSTPLIDQSGSARKKKQTSETVNK